MRVLAGGGLTFNGDTAQANALDDYEEGTWTPTIEVLRGASGQSYLIQNGRYTKIGDVATYHFDVELTAKGSLACYVCEDRWTAINGLTMVQIVAVWTY